MKTNRIWKCAVITLLIGCGICQASLSQVTPDIPSLTPPPKVHWIVTYQDSGAARPDVKPTGKLNDDPLTNAVSGGKRNRRLIKEEYEIGDKVAFVTKTYSNGPTDLIYLVDGVAYLNDTVTKWVRPQILSAYSSGDLRFSQKYPGFDWVKKEFFVNEQETAGRKCLHFKQTPTATKGNVVTDDNASMFYDPNVTSVEREAWIDEETSLPYIFRHGTLVGSYQYLALLNEPITLPPAIAKAVRVYNGYND